MMLNESLAEICNNARDRLLVTHSRGRRKQLEDLIPCVHNGCIAAEECGKYADCKMLELYYKTVIKTANEIQYDLLNRSPEKHDSVSGPKSRYYTDKK